MTGTDGRGAPASGRTRGAQPPGRAESRVAYPFIPLTDVKEMLHLIKGQGGRYRFDGLADALGQVKSSGAFRGRTGAGRMYGTVETEGHELVLTDLGRRACSPETEAAALAEAFLRVPLHQALYTRYARNGGKLPVESVIEADMMALGVPEAQVKIIRRVFLRSAETAGYFHAGKDRLSRPLPADGEAAGGIQDPVETKDAGTDAGREGPDAGMTLQHEWLRVLESKLPPEGEQFPRKQRQRWLELARVYIDLAYPDDEEPDVPSVSHNGIGVAHPAPRV